MHALQDRLRRLPAVDELLKLWDTTAAKPDMPRAFVADAARTVLQQVRDRLRQEPASPVPSRAECLQQLCEAVAATKRQFFMPVINATGVVLHTNLGRAPLAKEAAAAASALSLGYTNLEYRVEAGLRGSRHDHGEALLRRLTGAEAALVVNNNAAAIMLVLSALARGGEVVVSRGELIEIGGGFRVPEVMAQSGARLKEVGTTNRTRLADYEQAAGPETKAFLKVHTSNYRIVGFTESVTSRELAALGRRTGIPVLEDLGSGVFLDTSRYGLAHEPTVTEALAAGVDIVTFSGDKLLGGPQAGVIVGKADLVAQCKAHPLARAVRVDKMTLAALQATLRLYVEGEAEEKIPIWRMLSQSADQIGRRAEAIRASVAAAGVDAHLAIEAGESAVGGGSLPGETLPTQLLRVEPLQRSPEELAVKMRRCDPPLVGRVERGAYLLDLRTVDPDDDAVVEQLLKTVLGGGKRAAAAEGESRGTALGGR